MGRRLKRLCAPALAAGSTLAALMAVSAPAYASAIDRPFLRVSSMVILIGASDFSNNGGEAPVAVDFNVLDNVSSGTAAPDIIGVDGVTTNFNTGRFNATEDGSGSGYEFEINDAVSGGAFTSSGPHQTLDENDSYSAFEIDEDTDLSVNLGNRASRFLVVSNVPFDIYAQADDLTATGDFSGLTLANINYRLRVQRTGGSGVWRWGQRAQNPSTGGLGTIAAINDLGDMSAGFTKVFDGGRRTAAQRGTLLQQAVSFQSRYRLQSTNPLGLPLLPGALPDLANYDLSMGAGELGATVTYTVYTP